MVQKLLCLFHIDVNAYWFFAVTLRGHKAKAELSKVNVARWCSDHPIVGFKTKARIFGLKANSKALHHCVIVTADLKVNKQYENVSFRTAARTSWHYVPRPAAISETARREFFL